LLLDCVIKQAKQMQLPGYEFEARLEKSQLAASPNLAGLRELGKEANARGFKLIVRKAREASENR